MNREETPRGRRGRPRHGRVARYLAGATVTVLIGAPSCAGLAVPGRAEQDPGCPPLNPIAKRYVDRKAVCRRAREEVLHSLKTGKDPDWKRVFRDSLPAKHPRRHQPANHGHHATSGYGPWPQPVREPKPSASPNSAPGYSRTPTRHPPNQPQLRKSVTDSSSTAPSNRTAIPHRPRTDERGALRTPGRAAAFLLLAILGGVAIWQRKALWAQLDKRRFHHQRPRPAIEPASPSRRPGDAPTHDPFDWGGASLAGLGAEDAVRDVIMNVLTHRREHAIELVLTRSDAWRLLGIAPDTLQDERVPGLTLSDDDQQAYAHLRRPGFSRRLLVTCDNGDDCPLGQSRQDERWGVLTVATSTNPSAQTSATGGITPRPPSGPTTSGPHERTLRLPRPDALEQLLALPTLARQRPPRSTSQPRP